MKNMYQLFIFLLLIMVMLGTGCPLEIKENYNETDSFFVKEVSLENLGQRSINSEEEGNDGLVVLVKVFRESDRSWLPTIDTQEGSFPAGYARLTKQGSKWSGYIRFEESITDPIIFLLLGVRKTGESFTYPGSEIAFSGTGAWSPDQATSITITTGEGFNGSNAMGQGSATNTPASFGYGPHAGIGPGGGYIFFDKGIHDANSRKLTWPDTYTADESVDYPWRYLEAAPYGWSGTLGTTVDPKYYWGGRGIEIVGTEVLVGFGKSNSDTVLDFWDMWRTERIGDNITIDEVNYSSVQQQLLDGKIPLYYKKNSNNDPTTWDWIDMYAIQAVHQFNVNDENRNGLEDWFLPSSDTLQAIWWNLISDRSDNRGQRSSSAVGDFSTNIYWSSKHNSINYVGTQSFGGGSRSSYPHDSLYHIRPVRAF